MHKSPTETNKRVRVAGPGSCGTTSKQFCEKKIEVGMATVNLMGFKYN